MRIIGGEMKGRRLRPKMKHWQTRPTTDQAKEGLFNILHNRLDLSSCTVLDLFSGSGSVGLEFISRGATVCFVDKFKPCTDYIQSVLKEWDREEKGTVYCQDILRFLKKNTTTFDIIFADPPYDSTLYQPLIQQIFTEEQLKKDGILILEHDKKHTFTRNEHFDNNRVYGQSYFSFLSHR